jgi:ketosteroid isomerase-like protein
VSEHPGTDVEIVRQIYAAMDARDHTRIFELADPEIVVTQDDRLPWGGRFVGHDGLATFALGLSATIDSQVTIQAIVADGDEVVQCGHTRGTVVETGAPFDIAEIHRWTIRDGRAVRAHFTIETEEMLEVLGAPPERCPVCGLVVSSVGRDDVSDRLAAGCAVVAELLRTRPADAVATRPSPDRWSALEYSAHIRDVLYHLRDRVVIGLAENGPGFKPLYRDLRVDLGLYRADRAEVAATELELAAGLFGRTHDALDDAQLARPVLYTFPVEQVRTVGWMARHAVHEVEHHRADVEANLDAGR